jgi:hypothetical protein
VSEGLAELRKMLRKIANASSHTFEKTKPQKARHPPKGGFRN